MRKVKTSRMNQDLKNSDILIKINLSLFGISVVVGIILYNVGPFSSEYGGEMLCIILSLLLLFWGGIDGIKKLKVKNKKTKKKLRKYIGAITAIILGFYMTIVFSIDIGTTLYNSVEYVKGNFVNYEFKINSVELSNGRGVTWIDSAKATNVNTGESIGFKCNLEVGSLSKGKIYNIEYIPLTKRIIHVRALNILKPAVS